MNMLAYQIGHEVLGGDVGVRGVQRALKQQPSCAAEILIAGVTETLETSRNEEGIAKALKILKAAARQLDTQAAPSR